MHPSLLCLLLALPQAPTTQPSAQPSAAAAQAQAPAFISETRSFRLNDPIDLNLNLSGLQVVSLTFRREKVEPGFFQITEAPGLATRAFLKVANSTGRARRVAFALAMEDKEGRLLSAASTGRKPEKVQPYKSEDLELQFTLREEDVAKADHFKLIVEPRAD